MGSSIEHRAEFASDVAEVLAAVSGEDALRARLRQLGGKDATLEEHVSVASGVRFTLLQGIGAEQLPQAVSAVHRGDLLVRREQTFEADGEGGEGYVGETKAGVSGIPGEITARTHLIPEGNGTVQHTSGTVNIRMPLVGGKLESIVAERVTNLLRREADFTAKWLAGEA